MKRVELTVCGATHHVLAVLVRDVLLQTLLAAEQLVTFITLEELITWEDIQDEHFNTHIHST